MTVGSVVGESEDIIDGIGLGPWLENSRLGVIEGVYDGYNEGSLVGVEEDIMNGV